MGGGVGISSVTQPVTASITVLLGRAVGGVLPSVIGPIAVVSQSAPVMVVRATVGGATVPGVKRSSSEEEEADSEEEEEDEEEKEDSRDSEEEEEEMYGFPIRLIFAGNVEKKRRFRFRLLELNCI